MRARASASTRSAPALGTQQHEQYRLSGRLSMSEAGVGPERGDHGLVASSPSFGPELVPACRLAGWRIWRRPRTGRDGSAPLPPAHVVAHGDGSGWAEGWDFRRFPSHPLTPA